MDSNYGISISACHGLWILATVLLILSCERVDPQLDRQLDLTPKIDLLQTHPPDIRFEVTGRLLEGRRIDCLEPNYLDHTWVASGTELFHFHGDQVDSLEVAFPITDLSIAGDTSLWVASEGGGLGHLTAEGWTWYNRSNSGLLRDSLWNVVVGLDGRVWVSCNNENTGGVMVFDGRVFQLFSPENSLLNQRAVFNLEIDHLGRIYAGTYGKVGYSKVFRFANETWESLSGDGAFYFIWDFATGPSGVVYLIIDYSLSSYQSLRNQMFVYRSDAWEELMPEFLDTGYGFFHAMGADRRDYFWGQLVGSDVHPLWVFNGNSWTKGPESLFQGDRVTVLKADMDNAMWVGTAENGIFILDQDTK